METETNIKTKQILDAQGVVPRNLIVLFEDSHRWIHLVVDRRNELILTCSQSTLSDHPHFIIGDVLDFIEDTNLIEKFNFADKKIFQPTKEEVLAFKETLRAGMWHSVRSLYDTIDATHSFERHGVTFTDKSASEDDQCVHPQCKEKATLQAVTGTGLEESPTRIPCCASHKELAAKALKNKIFGSHY